MADDILNPRGLPYGSGAVDAEIYGSGGFEPQSRVYVRVRYPFEPRSVVLRGSYKVKARYTGEEATVEDIYSAATYRFMALACLDGPMFPYYTS